MEVEDLQVWLQNLVATRTPESPTLDFKRTAPDLRPEQKKKEFIVDLTALANTRGGRIVYGIDGENEGATELTPFSENPTALVGAMSSLAAHWIEPRIAGLRFITVPIGERFVLIADVPQQFNGPFLASFNKEQWFKCRHAADNVNMSYEQIRNAFGARAQIINDIRTWREKRLQTLRFWINQRRLPPVSWSILHIMPIAAFSTQAVLDLPRLDQNTLSSEGYRFKRYNLDGLQCTKEYSNQPPRNYCQIFREGMLEFAWTSNHPEDSMLLMGSDNFYASHDALLAAGKFLKAANLNGSVASAFALLNCGNRKMVYTARTGLSNTSQELLDDQAIFSEQYVEDVDCLLAGQQERLQLKSHLDLLWQAFGLSECEDITSDGEFAPNQ